VTEELYGGKPTFTYTPKDGGEPIIFPAHSTIRGEVDGQTLREFFWELDEAELSYDYQVFAYLKRSKATQEMKRRVVRLSDDELRIFLREWVNAEDDEQEPVIPPES
jgi:hypothetical protein